MAKNFKCWPPQWPKNLNYPERPVHMFLEDTAKRVPNRIAIPNEQLTGFSGVFFVLRNST